VRLIKEKAGGGVFLVETGGDAPPDRAEAQTCGTGAACGVAADAAVETA
jgi:hypothetical protein